MCKAWAYFRLEQGGADVESSISPWHAEGGHPMLKRGERRSKGVIK